MLLRANLNLRLANLMRNLALTAAICAERSESAMDRKNLLCARVYGR